MKSQTNDNRDQKPMQNAETKWEDLTIQNRFLFAKVMSDPENMLPFLQRVFPELEIAEIRYLEAEKTLEGPVGARGVRYDVYVKDLSTRAFTVEMQIYQADNIPKRSRYYSTMMDEDCLQKGQDYALLPNTYVIFICPFDLFGAGLHRYTFRNTCAEIPGLLLEDGSEKIFLYTGSNQMDVSDDLKNLLDFLGNRSSGVSDKDPFICQLKASVDLARKNANWRREYMIWQHEIAHEKRLAAEQGYAEGRAQGMAEGMAEGMAQGMADERLNTERERIRAENAEAEVRLLREQLKQLQKEKNT